jgi:hypothetical protein
MLAHAAELLAAWLRAGYVAAAELAAVPGLAPALEGLFAQEHEQLARAALQLRLKLPPPGSAALGA